MLAGLGLDAALGGVIGLLFGSFLNVVSYRLPKMMERQWAAGLPRRAAPHPAAQAPAVSAEAAPEPFNLLIPRSRCPACGHILPWYENVPVLSSPALRR